MVRHPHCNVVQDPGVQPRVCSDINVRIPDLVVTCSSINLGDRLLHDPVVLSSSNQKDTWDNVLAYTTIPSMRDILVLHSAEVRADLLARQPDGSWPENPAPLGPSADVRLDSIGFVAPLAVFYRTLT